MQRSPTCPKCLQNYEFKDFRPIGSHIPLLLSCGHGFCEGCLLKLARNQSQIKCPTCEAATNLEPSGERGVKNFLPDIYLLGVLTYNRRVAHESGQNRFISGPMWNFGSIYHLTANNLTEHEEVEEEEMKAKDDKFSDSKEGAESEHHCEECNQTATCICNNCDNCLFCQSCFDKYHKSMKRLQKHQPMPLSFPRKSDLECSEHGGRVLEFLDKDLNKALCSHCIIADEYKRHTIVPIGQLDDSLKEELESSLSSAKQILSMLKLSEKVIANVYPEITIIANQFCQDVRTQFAKMHTTLQMREANIMFESSKQFSQNVNLGGLISDCIQKQKRIQNVIKECELISKSPQALHLKIKEFIVKLDSFKEITCFAKRIQDQFDETRITVDESVISGLKTIGEMKIYDKQLVKMMKLNELNDEDMKSIQFNTDEQIYPPSGGQENDVLNASEAFQHKKRVYESAVLTNTDASYELVHVTFIKSPEHFYVQRCSDKERLQNMMQSLNKYCKSTDKQEDLVFFVEKDDLVCAQFLGDNNWYRAKVISARSKQQPEVIPTWENGLPVEVHYIDYGNAESLPLARLRKMKPYFLEVPEIAVPCSLMDIVPPDQKETWSVNSIKAFNSLAGEKRMLLNIRGRFDGKLFVDLRRPDNDEPIQDDERPISVRDALVFLEVAMFLSPASVAPECKPKKAFKEPQLPEAGQIMDVLVTHVVSPHEIYIQKFDSPINEVHNELARIYTNKNNGGQKIPFPYRNLVCAARFSEDKLWYRGQITHIYDNANVEVFYVDYGNSETTLCKDIRKLPDELLTVRKQAMLVKLKDVAPLNKSEEWSKETNNFLNVTILNKPMVMIVKDIEGGVLIVELCDTSTEDDIYINNLLVQNNFALSTGQSSADKVVSYKQQAANNTLEPDSFQADDDSSTIDAFSTYSDDAGSEYLPMGSWYQNPSFPQKKTFDVIGTYIDVYGHVFGHIAGSDADAVLCEMISKKLNEGEMDQRPGIENTNGLKINQPIVARFVDEVWYRCTVTKIIDDKNIEAEFIDFGNTDLVHVNEIRLESVFPEIPKQAVKLRLYGIESVRDDRTYPKEAQDTLSNIMVNKKFTATMRGPQRDSTMLNVDIKICSTGEDLAECLVKSDLARKIEIETQSVGNEAESNANRSIQHQLSLPATADFIQPTLPQIGVHFDVLVTQVSQPNMVYVQRLPACGRDQRYAKDEDDTEEIAKDQINELGSLSNNINASGFFDHQSPIERLTAGMACFAMYSQDDLWYRAQIISVSTKETKDGTITVAEVLFVDYGTSEYVPIERIRRISEEYLELPVQGICCEIAGVYPPQSAKGPFYKDTKWPIETMQTLYNVVADKRLIATILDYGPPVKVLLFDRQKTESETGEFCDLSVSKMLADIGLAVLNLSEDRNNSNTNSTDATTTILSPNRQILTKKRTSSKRLLELPNSSSDIED
eukprot:gene322-953_t